MVGTPPRPRREPWHAVGIVAGKECCEAVRGLRGRRYLSRTEAPQLPLPDCTQAASCRCTYRHYTDRRAGPRRGEEQSGLRKAAPSVEHRARRGRRDPDFD